MLAFVVIATVGAPMIMLSLFVLDMFRQKEEDDILRVIILLLSTLTQLYKENSCYF
jgi:hypothetical protein